MTRRNDDGMSRHRRPKGVKPSVVVLTHIPSPYQAELFDAVSADDELDLRVYYLFSRHGDRHWASRSVFHRAVFLDEDPQGISRAIADIADAHLAIFNFYNDVSARRLIALRARTTLPWAFWGERPRVHLLSPLTRLYRAWMLRKLHQSGAAVWGIGDMAVMAYRREFGPQRQYWNVPYFSDLGRFVSAGVRAEKVRAAERVLLFSGSLTRRKGVDLIATAFKRLLTDGFNLRLRVVGTGPLEQYLRRSLESCQDRVDFMGFRDWDDLPAEYGQADVLCVPSRYDGWGLVIPEGLAAGLPTIGSTQMGAAVELIRHGKSGWLVKPGDGEDLYRAMRDAVSIAPEDLDAMRASARDAISAHGLTDGVRRFVAASRGTALSYGMVL